MRGRDVFEQRATLLEECRAADVSHWAPNCSSFSRARERPIPGVLFSPKPLRSADHPKGIPEVLHGLKPSKRKKLKDDTSMADLAAEECLNSHRCGRYFSLEHLFNSIARHLPSWKILQREKGVYTTQYHSCMFEGSKRRKNQVLIHNIPELILEAGRTCESDRLCTRTGLRHLAWRPRVESGKIVSFATGEEREYPVGLCEAYAKGLNKLRDRTSIKSFVEVFSGPNAPLSKQVAEIFKITLPGCKLHTMKGVTTELTTIADLQAPRHPESLPQSVETNPYRLAAVEAGRQPSYGKRMPLIADGLQCPTTHVAQARKLSHPFSGNTSLKENHRNVIAFLERPSHEVVAWRLQQLKKLSMKVRAFKGKQAKANKSAAWTAEKLGLKIQTELMRSLQEDLDILDTEVPDICLKGLGILGKASKSPFFDDFEVRPTMSSAEFHERKTQRSREMINRVLTMGRASPKEMTETIWTKTLKEVRSGTMGPPMSLGQVEKTFAHDYQVVPSFGLRQGCDEAGRPKYRRIDDYTASRANPSSHRLQKVPMTMPDYVGVLSKEMGRKGWDIQFTTDDMKSAYRQIPLDPRHVRYAITAVYDPNTDSVALVTMYGQPFGAGHSVPNFCRVAEWLARFCQVYFKICTDHFFDDFFTIEPSETIQSAMRCLQESFSLLGFELDPDKTQTPSQVCNILGVVFNSTSLQLQRRLLVESKPTRIQNLKECIEDVLQRDSLTPSLAASIVGKFQFLCSTLFGKVGRCCTAPIRHRQYSFGGNTRCTAPIRTSLRLMKHFLDFTPSRKLFLDVTSPVILYTDASDVPERIPQQVLGAVLIDGEDILHTHWAVAPSIISRWIQKQNHMSQLELLAAPLALATWKTRLFRRDILLFIDNEGACANLVKGYSPQTDSSAIVGHFWLMACSLELNIYIDRVESKSLADSTAASSLHGDLFGVLLKLTHLRTLKSTQPNGLSATMVTGGIKRQTPSAGGECWRGILSWDKILLRPSLLTIAWGEEG